MAHGAIACGIRRTARRKWLRCHPGESHSLPRRKPGSSLSPLWIPACAGMTIAAGFAGCAPGFCRVYALLSDAPLCGYPACENTLPPG